MYRRSPLMCRRMCNFHYRVRLWCTPRILNDIFLVRSCFNPFSTVRLCGHTVFLTLMLVSMIYLYVSWGVDRRHLFDFWVFTGSKVNFLFCLCVYLQRFDQVVLPRLDQVHLLQLNRWISISCYKLNSFPWFRFIFVVHLWRCFYLYNFGVCWLCCWHLFVPVYFFDCLQQRMDWFVCVVCFCFCFCFYFCFCFHRL